MDAPSSSTRELAKRLLAVEAASTSTTGTPVRAAARVCEKLRVSLTRLAGADGFSSFLRRALVLARVEVPLLHHITVKHDGSMDGLDSLAAQDVEAGVEAEVAITAHLLGLLVTFVGQPLTMRLVHEAWPELSQDE